MAKGETAMVRQLEGETVKPLEGEIMKLLEGETAGGRVNEPAGRERQMKEEKAEG